jgi:multidrug efflux pump subunit AcrB
MIRIINEMIKRKLIVILLLILWIFAGLYSYYIIPKQENPDTSLPGAIITTIYPGATSQEVEKMVTTKIEDAVNEVGSIQSLDSISMNSASIVIVLFNTDADGPTVLGSLREKISTISTSLPDMAYEPEIDTDLSTSPQFIISLSGADYSQEDLVTYAQEIKDSILDVDGVERIDIDGQLDKQVNVVCDIDALNLYNISIEDIVGLMKAQNLSIPSGSIEYESGIINVNTPATFSSLQDIENIVVAGSESDTIGFVQLKDIAKVSIDYGEGFSYQQDGETAILLTGYFKDNVNGVLIGKDVRKVINEISQQLPPNINYHEVVYSSEDTNKSINNFILNLLESMVLIITVIMLGVKLKNALVVSVSLPFSIFATFLVMYWQGIEFQFISIMALIISLGILVDNGIVVSDAIQQKLNENFTRKEAIESAVKETAAPVFTSQLTTIITFGILLFVPGAVGTIVATIPFVVITSLISSYIVAMFVIPFLAYFTFSKESEAKITKKSPVKAFFNKALKLSLGHKKTTLAIAISTLAISIVLVLSLGLTFFPFSDKPIIYINVKGESLNLAHTTEVVEEIQAILDEEPLVTHYTSSIGKGLPRFFLTVPTLASSNDNAQIMIELDNKSDDFVDNMNIGAKLQERFNNEIVGAKIEVKYLVFSKHGNNLRPTGESRRSPFKKNGLEIYFNNCSAKHNIRSFI